MQTIEKPAAGRATIVKSGDSIEITIPMKTNWFLVIFYFIWLGGWAMGEIVVINQLRGDTLPDEAVPFLAFWLAGWTVGGIYTTLLLLWILVGREIVEVEMGVLELRKEIFQLKRIKKYQVNEIRHFSVSGDPSNNVWSPNYASGFLNRKSGVLQFDYGSKTIKFGVGIEEAEGRILVEALKMNSNFTAGNFTK